MARTRSVECFAAEDYFTKEKELDPRKHARVPENEAPPKKGFADDRNTAQVVERIASKTFCHRKMKAAAAPIADLLRDPQGFQNAASGTLCFLCRLLIFLGCC